MAHIQFTQNPTEFLLDVLPRFFTKTETFEPTESYQEAESRLESPFENLPETSEATIEGTEPKQNEEQAKSSEPSVENTEPTQNEPQELEPEDVLESPFEEKVPESSEPSVENTELTPNEQESPFEEKESQTLEPTQLTEEPQNEASELIQPTEPIQNEEESVEETPEPTHTEGVEIEPTQNEELSPEEAAVLEDLAEQLAQFENKTAEDQDVTTPDEEPETAQTEQEPIVEDVIREPTKIEASEPTESDTSPNRFDSAEPIKTQEEWDDMLTYMTNTYADGPNSILFPSDKSGFLFFSILTKRNKHLLVPEPRIFSLPHIPNITDVRFNDYKDMLLYYATCMPDGSIDPECDPSLNLRYQAETVQKWKTPYDKLTISEKEQVKAEALKTLGIEYKIHLMPTHLNAKGVIEQVLKLFISRKLKSNTLKVILHIRPEIQSPDGIKQVLPIIVIYVYGEENATETLHVLQNHFLNVQGTNETPGYNKKVTSLIYYAGGDRDVKNIYRRNHMENRHVFEDNLTLYKDQDPLVPSEQQMIESNDVTIESTPNQMSGQHYTVPRSCLVSKGVKYTLGRVIGRGTWGVVYEAKDNNTFDKAVKISKFSKKQSKSWNDEVKNSLLASKNGFGPHVYDHWTCESGENHFVAFLLMDKYKQSLESFIQALDSIEVPTVIQTSILNNIHKMRRANFDPHDVRLSNILVDDSGRNTVFADFASSEPNKTRLSVDSLIIDVLLPIEQSGHTANILYDAITDTNLYQMKQLVMM